MSLHSNCSNCKAMVFMVLGRASLSELCLAVLWPQANISTMKSL